MKIEIGLMALKLIALHNKKYNCEQKGKKCKFLYTKVALQKLMNSF